MPKLLLIAATIAGLCPWLLVQPQAQQVGQVQVGGTPTVSADLVKGPAHMRVYVDVTDASGKVTNWNLDLISQFGV